MSGFKRRNTTKRRGVFTAGGVVMGIATALSASMLMQTSCPFLPGSTPTPTPLAVDAGADQAGTTGDTFTLNAAAAVTGGNAPVPLWTIAGPSSPSVGNSASVTGATVTINVAGTYTATLSALDADNNMAADTIAITVTDPPAPVITVDAGADQTANGGDAVNLTALATGDVPPTSFNWQLTASGTAGSVVLTNAGSQTATATFTNDAEGTFSFSVTVGDSASPTAGAGSDSVDVTLTPAAGATALVLTTGTDTITGTASDDTIDGSLDIVGGAFFMTLNNGDSIDGGGGTDTLNAQLLTTAGALVVTPLSLTMLEVFNFEVTGVNNATVGFGNADAVTTINHNSSGGGNLLVNGLTIAPTTFGVTNGATNFTATVNVAALTAATDTATLNLSGVTGGTMTLQPAAAGNGYETLTVNSNGGTPNAPGTITDGAGTSLATVNVGGSQDINLGAPLDLTVTTLNASGASGKVTVDLTGVRPTVTATGGSADDTIDLSGTFTAGTDTVDGGAGTDTLIVAAADTGVLGTAAAVTGVTNVETISLDTQLNGNLNVTHFGASNAKLAGIDGTARTVTIANGGSVELTANAGANAKTYATSTNTASDSFTLVLNGAGITHTGNVAAPNFESMTIDSKGTAANTITGTTVINNAGGVQKITAMGAQNLTLTGAVTADELDASTLTGALLMGANPPTLSIIITGGSGADNLLGSVNNDTLIGGAGIDTLNGESGFDDLTGGSEADNFRFERSLTSDNVLDWEDGLDILVISSGNADFNDSAVDFGTGLAQGTGAATSLVATAAGATTIRSVAQNAGAAAFGAADQLVKLTTAVPNAGTDQTTFNAAIGTATLTGGLAGGSDHLVSWYDTTNGQMVVAEVNITGTTATVLETADVVSVICRITMSTTDYTNFTTADLAFVDI